MKFVLFTLFLFVCFSRFSSAEVKPARIFSDNMVIQRNLNFPVWGTASPDEKIIVSISDKIAYGVANKDGAWKIVVPALPAGGPYQLSIKGSNTIEISNVLVGDVWFASGQSNMEWKLKQGVKNHQEEIANARYPQIRFFAVPNRAAPFPRNDLEEGSWVECSPETAGDFSAVAYFFGRGIHLQQDVPIGLIDCTWGGTTVEAWTSYERLYTLPSQRETVAQQENWEPDIKPNEERTKRRAEIAENSNLALAKGVTKAGFNDFEWNLINVPEWDTPVEGVIWLRKSVEIPALYKKQDLVLHLGKPRGTAQLFFNEEKIGAVSGPNPIEVGVPGDLVKPGKNQLAIRLAHPRYNDHLQGRAEEFYLATSTGAKIADLSGEWKYNNRLEPEYPEIKFYYRYPAALFNGMVNPVVGYGIKGVIWYQGENNTGNAEEYYRLFPALIDDWRIRWGLGHFPFLYVQLANYGDPADDPSESAFAMVRDAQLATLAYPGTGIAVTIDIGEQYDIHPRNKQDVGNRLVLAARKVAYGEDLVSSGPIYHSMKIAGKEIVVSFRSVGGGLVAKEGELKGFVIAGQDRKFQRAKAKIVGGKIYVSSENVPTPVAVRYAWADNPEGGLYNKEGLPASPFRTDDW